MLKIQEIDKLGHEIDPLASEAGEQGFAFMDRFRREWLDGSNRFDGVGEGYYAAFLDGRLVGLGGLNQDPYQADPAVGRVRHLYVLSDARRAGIGRALVEQIVARARERFALLRLRTTTTPGALFYEKLGFLPVDRQDATHILDLANPAVPRFG